MPSCREFMSTFHRFCPTWYREGACGKCQSHPTTTRHTRCNEGNAHLLDTPHDDVAHLASVPVGQRKRQELRMRWAQGRRSRD